MNNFSKNLKYYRSKIPMTQKEFADKLNINVRSYQRYELGEREPNINTLIDISDILKISIDDLVR